MVMALTVQQLLADAKKLSSRLREHDQTADLLLGRSTHVLSEVEGMRLYQEDTENLNEVAHNRPRAALVLGIQQENRHFRTLQQENKELRAALEEHQSALELIMSKYRQHVTRLVRSPATSARDNLLNNYNNNLVAERTEKICEMAGVMKEAARADEEACNTQQELLARLVTENKGLREMLEISGKIGGSARSGGTGGGCKKPAVVARASLAGVSVSVQTEAEAAPPEPPTCDCNDNVVEVQVTLPRPQAPKALPTTSSPQGQVGAQEQATPYTIDVALEEVQSIEGDSDETGSEDESVKFDTIKLARRDRAPSKEYQKCNGANSPQEVLKVDAKFNPSEVVTVDVINADDRSIESEADRIHVIATEIKTTSSDVAEEVAPEELEGESEASECMVNRLVDQLVSESVEVSRNSLLETRDTVTVTLSPSKDATAELETTTVSLSSGTAPAPKEVGKDISPKDQNKPKPVARVKQGNKGKRQGNRS